MGRQRCNLNGLDGKHIREKNTGRFKEIKGSPRLEPVSDGDQMAPINPPLLLRAIKGSNRETCSEVNCALEPNKESVSFADQFSTAHTLYNKTILTKASVEAVVNFHRLLYMEIQFLMGCDVTWKNATALGGSDELMSSESPESASLSLISPVPNPAALAEASAATSSSSAAAAAPAAQAPAPAGAAASAAPAAPAPPSTKSTSLPNSEKLLADIKNWDHRSGQFPLTESAMAEMDFSRDLPPRYYWAAALLLFMRVPRTPKEDEVFQRLSEVWPDWHGGRDLNYAFLQEGPPKKGRNSYTEAEVNWCEVRMKELDKGITNEDARAQLGLPNKTSSRERRQRELQVEKEQSDLLSGRASKRKADDGSDSPSVAATPAVAPGKRGKGDHGDDGITSAEGAPRSARSRVHRPASASKSAAASRTLASDVAPTTPDSVPKRGKLDADGRIISAKDGRPLVANNLLRNKYKSNYRNPSNTRRWAGSFELDLGQAFKLAVWTHYGPAFPTERNGNFEQREALFRTAAWYALSMDGTEAEEIMQSPEAADFYYIQVSSAKQMRYLILTQGRVFFGDNVFTTAEAPSALYAREFQVFSAVSTCVKSYSS